jgi:Ala-tRNA(Pro) deacylase
MGESKDMDMQAQQQVYEKLKSLGINYEVIEHPAVFTIEEMDELGITDKADICKNLFVRDAKGRQHYIIVLCKDKRADLKNIEQQLGSTKLSFGSDERLYKYLKLTKGEVTPLGIINDPNCDVEVVFDKDLKGKSKLGVHPNDNTATVVLSFNDLKRFVEDNGNTIHYVTI